MTSYVGLYQAALVFFWTVRGPHHVHPGRKRAKPDLTDQEPLATKVALCPAQAPLLPAAEMSVHHHKIPAKTRVKFPPKLAPSHPGKTDSQADSRNTEVHTFNSYVGPYREKPAGHPPILLRYGLSRSTHVMGPPSILAAPCREAKANCM
jgi:hypothetical protein